jgi:uncharacterized protein
LGHTRQTSTDLEDDSDLWPLPRLTGTNEFFWKSGEDGWLRILRCSSCGLYIHPPSPICRACHSMAISPEKVSGRGRLSCFTVNHHRWYTAIDPPYVIAEIELVEQTGLTVLSNVVGTPPDEMKAGVDVQVEFVRHEDIYLPVFRVVEDAVLT